MHVVRVYCGIHGFGSISTLTTTPVGEPAGSTATTLACAVGVRHQLLSAASSGVSNNSTSPATMSAISDTAGLRPVGAVHGQTVRSAR